MILLASGFCFPEAPRWHAGHLWFSDRDAPSVFTTTLDGDVRRVVDVPTKAMGLGFAGGTPYVVSQAERRIFAIRDGRLELFADLSDLTPHWINDMLVLPDGSGYLGSFGFDLMNHGDPSPTQLIRFTSVGDAHFTGPALLFPNGIMQLTSGELAVAESFGSRITILSLDPNGEVTSGRTLSNLGGHGHPDGIAIDAEDGIWYADTLGGFVARLDSSGVETHRIEVPAAHATSCAFVGGGDQLAITATDDLYPPDAMVNRSGRIYLETVAIPAPWATSPEASQ